MNLAGLVLGMSAKYAARKKMQRKYEVREAAKRAEAEEKEIPTVKIVSEVKIK